MAACYKKGACLCQHLIDTKCLEARQQFEVSVLSVYARVGDLCLECRETTWHVRCTLIGLRPHVTVGSYLAVGSRVMVSALHETLQVHLQPQMAFSLQLFGTGFHCALEADGPGGLHTAAIAMQQACYNDPWLYSTYVPEPHICYKQV